MSLPTEWQPTEVDEAVVLQNGGGIDIWGILLRRKWIVLLGLILAMALGYIYLLQAAPVYESAAQVLIEDKAPPSFDLAELQLVGTITNESKHVIMLRSPRVVAEAFRKHKLDQLPSFSGLDEGFAIGNIIEDTEVEPVAEGSEVYQISYRGPAAEDTPVVVQALLDQYREFLEATRDTRGDDTRKLFRQASDELESQLDDLETEYEQFRRDAPLIWTEKIGTNPHQLRMSEIEKQRTVVHLQISGLKARLETLKSALLEEGIDQEALRMLAHKELGVDKKESLEARLLPLRLEEQDLLTRYGSGHPMVKRVRRQIEFTQLAYQDESLLAASDNESEGEEDSSSFLVNYLHTIEQQLRQAQQQVVVLNELFDVERVEAKKLEQYTAREDKLSNSLLRKRALYDTIIKNLESAQLVEDVEGYNFEELASPGPGKKVEPVPMKVFALSGVLGLLGGFGIAYLVDLADKGFRNPEEVSQALRLPVIGHIPLMELDRQKVLPGSAIAPIMCTIHRTKSPQAESYRSVRTALYFNTRGQKHQIIQVTSPTPGDGKSTLSANLAVTIAHSGKNVLLLDADFRRPTLHKVFGMQMDVGLASVVEGHSEPEDAIQQVEEVPNLSVMACGVRPENPSELLSSLGFQNVLDLLRERFDFVIVDTPPLLAVTDPSAVAARVDGVILTFRIDKRARPLTIRARDMLAELGAETIGVVVNGVGERHGYGYGGYRYGYGGRYGYSYGYGYGQSRKDKTGIHKYFEEPKKNGNGQHKLLPVTRSVEDKGD